MRPDRKKLNCFMTDDTALHEERDFNVSVTDSEAESLFEVAVPVPVLQGALDDTKSAKEDRMLPERKIGKARRD